MLIKAVQLMCFLTGADSSHGPGVPLPVATDPSPRLLTKVEGSRFSNWLGRRRTARGSVHSMTASGKRTEPFPEPFHHESLLTKIL